MCSSDLPRETRRALASAANALDTELTLDIVASLRADHPAEARLISELVEAYRFDRVAALCDTE